MGLQYLAIAPTSAAILGQFSAETGYKNERRGPKRAQQQCSRDTQVPWPRVQVDYEPAAAARGSCSFWVAYTPPKSRRRLLKPFFLCVTQKPCHEAGHLGVSSIHRRSELNSSSVCPAGFLTYLRPSGCMYDGPYNPMRLSPIAPFAGRFHQDPQ